MEGAVASEEWERVWAATGACRLVVLIAGHAAVGTKSGKVFANAGTCPIPGVNKYGLWLAVHPILVQWMFQSHPWVGDPQLGIF